MWPVIRDSTVLHAYSPCLEALRRTRPCETNRTYPLDEATGVSCSWWALASSPVQTNFALVLIPPIFFHIRSVLKSSLILHKFNGFSC